MSMFPILALVLFLSMPPPLAETPEVDVDMLLGDSFAGAIDLAGDVDAARFDGVAGQSVTFNVSPAKGAALEPVLQLLEADTLDPVATSQPKGKGAVLKAALPGTGSYLLLVSDASDATGGYKLKSKGALPKGATKPDSEPGPGPGSAAVHVDVLAASWLDASIKPAKGTQAAVGALTLTGPAGDVPLAAYTKVKGEAVLLKKVPLPDFGTYVLEAVNSGDPQGELAIKATIVKPKIAKLQLVEGDFELLLDASVPLNGTSPDKKLPVSGELVNHSGQGLPASVQWSCDSGSAVKSGSLKVKDGAFQGKLPLTEGDNCILISANRGQASQHLDCTCNLGFVFGGELAVTPVTFHAQVPMQVGAQVVILDEHVNPQDVWLAFLPADGSGEVEMFRLVDDGNFFSGDLIASDGLYNGFAVVQFPAIGTADVRIVAGRLDQADPARSEIHGLAVDQAPPPPQGHGRPVHVALPPQGEPTVKPILHPLRPASDHPVPPPWSD